jgi:hypothetical protein
VTFIVQIFTDDFLAPDFATQSESKRIRRNLKQLGIKKAFAATLCYVHWLQHTTGPDKELMWSPFCLCLYIPPINFWMPEPIFMKLGMYIMTPEPISTAYFINPSLYLLGNGSVKTSPQQRIHASFSMRSVSYQKESRRFVLPSTFCSVLVFTSNKTDFWWKIKKKVM